MEKLVKFAAKNASKALGVAASKLVVTNKYPLGEKAVPAELKK